jgi:protein Xni
MRVMLLDGLNLIRRIHAGVPGADAPTHMDGVVDAVTRSVARALSEQNPTHAVLVMDDPDSTWRRELFSAYKQNRKPMPDDLRTGLPRVVHSIAEVGIRSVQVNGFEADDVIATMASSLGARGIAVVVLSTDKSMLGLLDAGVEVRDHFSGRNFAPQDVVTRFGVQPAQLPEYLALAGDNSQNVPGVRGIGAKTAAGLLQTYGDLRGVFAAVDALPTRHANALRKQVEDTDLYTRISTLRLDVDVGINLSDFRLNT